MKDPKVSGDGDDDAGADDAGEDDAASVDGDLFDETEDSPVDGGGDPDESAELAGDSVRREALSNYIHPCSAAVRDAYRNAVRRLRYPETRPPEKRKPRDAAQGSTWIDASAIGRVMAWLAGRAEQKAGKSSIEHHNDLVIYVSAMLVIATGHRRARQIFPFLHDWDLQDLIAFLADKQREGSEARFVPLTEAVAAQLQDYLDHVQRLVNALERTDPILAKSLRHAIGLKADAKLAESTRHTGPLFTIRRGHPRPVSTAAVGFAINRAARALGIEVLSAEQLVPAFRRNIATWLADDGVGGGSIEMLLGHVREKHPFGATSVWVPLEQFQALREPLSRYLAELGVKPIGAPRLQSDRAQFVGVLPTFERSAQSYEQRAIEADEARLRARQAVLEVVPEPVLLDDHAVDLNDDDVSRIAAAIRARHGEQPVVAEAIVSTLEAMVVSWSNDSGYAVPRAELLKPVKPQGAQTGAPTNSYLDHSDVIRRVAIRVLPKSKVKGKSVLLLDQQMIDKLRDEIAIDLKSDPSAQAKVLTAFSELAAGWRRAGKYRVTAASLNLARFAPGPISVSFARHLAISKAVLLGLPGRIEEFLHKGSPPADRLGAIAVLLVCCEAVLDRGELAQVLLELQESGPKRFSGQLQLRATIDGRIAQYERTVDLTYKTSAAVCGYLASIERPVQIGFADIEAAANRLLESVLQPRRPMTLARLLIVMRPFWFLRLPGSVLATVSGSQECNAPSPASTALLLGEPAPPYKREPPTAYVPDKNVANDIKAATRLTSSLLTSAKGKIEEFQGASRQQRQRLRKTFAGRLQPELEQWMTRSQIVDLWVHFVYYLLEVGGDRADVFSFRTLVTYQDRILDELFETAWNLDLLSCSAEDLAKFYRDVLSKVDPAQREQAKTPLKYFMRYLHQWWEAPNTRYEATTERRKRNARSVVVPLGRIDEAVNLAAKPDGRASKVGTASAALLSINHAFGLRTLEGYGLMSGDFLDGGTSVLRVRRNVVRSLKTTERSIPVCLAAGDRQSFISTMVQASTAEQTKKKSALFVDPDGTGKLFGASVLSARGNWAMKASTGDVDAIIYSLRHTFATSLMSQMLMPGPSFSIIAMQMSDALNLPSDGLKQLDDCSPGNRVWAHQLDRLALWLGQAGAQTLSTTYWHGAWWVAGERCALDALRVPWPSSVFGALLGVTESAFRHRFPKREDGKRKTEAERTAAAIFGLVEKGQVPRLDLTWTPSDGDAHDAAGMHKTVAVLDALLMQRRARKADLDILAVEVARELNLLEAETQRFFKAYQLVAESTAFQDFEPDELRVEAGGRKATKAGSKLRSKLLSDVIVRMGSDETFCEHTLAVIDEWETAVVAGVPLLVSRSLVGLSSHIAWMKKIGYERGDLVATVFRVSDEECAKFSGLVESIKVSTKRLARNLKIDMPCEFGISPNGSRVRPNIREFHRVLFALACARRAGLLPDS